MFLRIFSAFLSAFALVAASGCCPCRKPDTAADAKAASAEQKDQGEVVYDNIPAIPDETRQRVGRYLNARGNFIADISDDGGKVLLSIRSAQTYQAHIAEMPLGARTQVTFTDEHVSRASFVPGTTDRIIYVSDKGGNEEFRIFNKDFASGKTTAITREGARVQRYVWSSDGSKVAFSYNARNGKDMDIYTCDGQSPESVKKVVEVSGDWEPLDWSLDGSQIIAMEYISIADSRLYLIDAATGKVSQITPKDKIASYREAVFGADKNTIYVTTDRDGEFVELYEVNLKTGAWTSLTKDIRWNIEHIAISGDAKSLVFSANEEGYSRLYAYETATRKVRGIDGVPEGIVSDLRFARKANKVAFTVDSATKSEDAYAYDLDANKLVRWTNSEMDGIDPASLIAPKLIRFKSFDGVEIPAFYFQPKGNGPFPVVISIHGGPESQARPGFHPYFQYLAKEMGIAVLMPNVRGSDGYGKTYLSMDNGFKREDSVRDIGALLDWIKTRSELDSSRVGVTGGSYGGYMVLTSLVHYPDRIVAGVDNVGISNFVSFLENTEKYRRDLRRAEYGDERDPKMREFFDKISPLHNAEKIKSALFVAHGANDPRVPATETEQIVKAVRAQGGEVWYMLAKNEGHGFVRKGNRDNFYLLMLIFFERQLLK